MARFPKKMLLIVVLMALAYLAFAASIEYAKRHPIVDDSAASLPPSAKTQP